jgi:transposase
MVGCGVDQRWRSGCRRRWAVRSLLNGGGITSSGWATVHVCLVRSTPKRMRKPSRLLKKLPEQVEAVRHVQRHKQVELWSMDEHRIGLKAILRRVWAPKGATVVARVAPRYQWMYVYAFVHPQSGRSSWFLAASRECRDLLPGSGVVCTRRVGAGADKEILLLLDGAGWHKSASLSLPSAIHLLFLPAYSPEIQPAERLWPLSNEPLANRVFPSLDELEQVQAERCRWLQDHPEIVRAHTCFHWWPSLDTT